MPLRRTEDGARKLYQRLLDEAAAKKTIAARLYPNLANKPAEEPKRRAPIDGWGHLNRKQEKAK
jgi:hypothetical protein